MNNELKRKRKQILSNPVTHFTALHADIDRQLINELNDLWQEHKDLKSRQKEEQLRKNIISRQIGEAKRKGEPLDDLKASMLEQSARLKTLTSELGDIEQQLFAFFNLADRPAETENADNQTCFERIYSSREIDTGTISVSLLEDQHDEWNAYVQRNPAATIYHRAEWRDLIETAYGNDGLFFAAHTPDGAIVGILPLIRLKSRLFGDYLVSMPYFGTGGAIADHPDIEARLMQAANEYASQLSVDYIEYRDDIPRTGLPMRTEKVNMVLSLPDSSSELWNGFSSKLSAQIKRAQREDPVILSGHGEYLDDFYSVYTRNLRDLGSPAHSKTFIQNILESLRDESQIYVIRLGSRAVSAALLIRNKHSLDIPLASTIRDVNRLGINMLLYWEVLKYATDNGFRLFNFGRSSKDTGTFRFKQQWGAREKPLYYHYWLGSSKELPGHSPSNPKYALAINTWKHLPVPITRWLGPLIVNKLP